MKFDNNNNNNNNKIYLIWTINTVDPGVSPLLSQYWDGPARRSHSAISYIVLLKFHILGRRVGIQISVVYLPSVPVYGIWHFRYITVRDMTPGTCIPTLCPSIWKFELPLHSSLTQPVSCVCDSSCWQINYRQLPMTDSAISIPWDTYEYEFRGEKAILQESTLYMKCSPKLLFSDSGNRIMHYSFSMKKINYLCHYFFPPGEKHEFESLLSQPL